MKQQDKLRKSLREHYDNQEVPFQESDWQQASALLAKERAKRKRRGLAGIFLMGMVLLLGVLGFMFNADVAPANDQHLAVVPMQKNALPVIAKDTEVKTSTTAEPKQPKLAAKKIFNAKVSQTKYFEKEVSRTLDKANGISNHKEGAITNKPVTLPLAHLKQMDESSSETKSDALQVSTAIQQAKNDLMTENLPEVLAFTKQVEKVEDEQPLKEKEMLSTPIGDTAQVAVRATAVPEVSTMQSANELSVENAESASTTPLQSAVSGTPAVAGAAINDSLPPSLDLMREGLVFETGINWFYGWKTSLKRDARGISPMAAIHYMTPIGRKAAFLCGMAYLYVPQLSTTKKVSREYSYVYGEQINVMEITPTSIHYLMMPLRYHLVLNSKNSLGIGVNVAYLFNVQAKVHTYTETPGIRSGDKTVKLWGYTEGISKLDGQLALGYRRRLASRFALQTELFLGLIDVKQNDFFKLNSKERNSGAKLSLIYYAFKK